MLFGYGLIILSPLLTVMGFFILYYIVLIFFAILSLFLDLTNLNFILDIAVRIIRCYIIIISLLLCLDPIINITARLFNFGFRLVSKRTGQQLPLPPYFVYLPRPGSHDKLSQPVARAAAPGLEAVMAPANATRHTDTARGAAAVVVLVAAASRPPPPRLNPGTRHRKLSRPRS